VTITKFANSRILSYFSHAGSVSSFSKRLYPVSSSYVVFFFGFFLGRYIGLPGIRLYDLWD